MNNLRRIFGFLIVLMVAAFAAPSIAATGTKFFFAQFPSVLPKPITTIDVTFYNATPPPGVSTINSIKIGIDSPVPPGFTITSVQMVLPVTASVSLSPQPDGRSYILTNFAGIKNNKSATFRLTLLNAPNTCTGVQWNAAANTGNSYPGGDEFSPTRTDLLATGMGCDGRLACGDTLDPLATNPPANPNLLFGDAGFAGGFRGLNNKDGSACYLVNYDFTNDIVVNNDVLLRWDTNVQPNAAFSLRATFRTEDVDPTGWPVAKRPKVAWEFSGAIPINVTYGVACMSPTLPAPYGTLAAGIITTSLPSPTSIYVTATTLPAAPFPIVIDTERMKVITVAGSSPNFTLTVNRGDGGTTPTIHAATSLVMSTPLPINPNPKLADGVTDNPYVGEQVPMCIWDHGWTSVGINPLTGVQQIRYSTQWFDIGDGFMSLE